MVSVCISFRNDFEEISGVVRNLLETAQSDDFEIIIYNDGSFYGDATSRPLELNLPHIKIINNRRSYGVGYAFDRAVEQARGDIITLMGSDVYPKDGWYENIRNAVLRNHNTLGCSVCLGINPTRMSLDDPKNFKRYGADLLFYVETNDLPKESVFRSRQGGYTGLFQSKWLFGKQSDEPYEIPCVLGAFYFTSKEYYQKIGGWDTKPNNSFCGHRFWGHLEPHISLKSWLTGGGCTIYPDIETAHVFSRVTNANIYSKGARSMEWSWWNALWILETMIMDESLRKRLYNFVHPELNFNVARKMIRDNYDEVKRARDRNRSRFKNDHTIFTKKFNYDFNI
jgi:glycosyltransferase involved in cell wall biosynthesis